VILLTNKIEHDNQIEITLDLIQTSDDYNSKLSRDTLQKVVELLLTMEKTMIDLRQSFHQLTHTDSEEVIVTVAHKAIELTNNLFSPCHLLTEAIRTARYEMTESRGEEFDA
jgi:hypothetical protein